MRKAVAAALVASAFTILSSTADTLDSYRTELSKALQAGDISKPEFDATLLRAPRLSKYLQLRHDFSLSTAFKTLAESLTKAEITSTTPEPLPSMLPLKTTEMKATINKPYTAFVLNGKLYDVKNLVGGHNGVTAAACKASPPVYNESTQQWEVKLHNNLIDFEFPTPLGSAHVTSIPMSGSAGQEGLVVSRNKDVPTFPADNTFTVQLKATLPAGLVARTREPLVLRAENLNSWPPPAGTRYVSTKPLEFYLENAQPNDSPVLTINPDTTVLATVQVVQ